MKLSHLLLGTCLLLLSASSAQAQRAKSSTDSEPCCNIISINAATAVVTARDKAGKTFQFSVQDAGLLKSLRAGQAVFADFGTGKVRIHGSEPCCSIVTSPAVKPDVNPIEPCCGITALNTATGIVTAKELATGRMFRFEVKDAKLLGTLKVGQKVFADFGSSKVRIHAGEPCCAIIGHGMN